MLSANTKNAIEQLKALSKHVYNFERKSIRRASASALKVAWDIIHTEYPQMPKNSKARGIRPFKDRMVVRVATSKSPMESILKSETRAYSLINEVVGNRLYMPQRGLKASGRPQVAIASKWAVRIASKPFIARVKNSTVVMGRFGKRSDTAKTLKAKGLWALLTEPKNAQRIETAAEEAMLSVLGDAWN